MSLESDNAEEDQEVLDDLDHEEQDEEEAVAVVVQDELAQGSVPNYSVPCKGNVCYCEDEWQVTFFTSDEEYYEELERASNVHPGELDKDYQYWSSEDGAVSEGNDYEVPGVNRRLHRTDKEDGDVAEDADTEIPGVVDHQQRICNTKYGSKQLVHMEAILRKSIVSMSKGQGLRIKALADSGSSASIISQT